MAAEDVRRFGWGSLGMHIVPFQPQVFEYSVYEVGLGQVDAAVLLSINVYSQEVLDISLDRDVKFRSLDVFDDGLDLRPVGPCQHGVIRVQYVHHFAFVKYTLIHLRLHEPNFFDQLSREVLIPCSPSILTPVHVLVQFQAMLAAVASFDVESSGHLHVQSPLYRRLWKGQHVINLYGVPAMLGRQY